MRVIIINPYLHNCSGHEYNYTVALRQAISKKNVSVQIWANLYADSNCLNTPDTFPYFTEIVSAVFTLSWIPLIFFKVIYRFFRLILQFQDRIFRNPSFQLGQTDVFFIHTVYLLELLPLSIFLLCRAKSLARYKCKFVIGYNYSYIRNSTLATWIFKVGYQICNWLLHRSHLEIIYCADSVQLCKVYKKIFHQEVDLVPIPLPAELNQFNKPVDSKNLTGKNPGGKCKIAFLGATRYNKGFDLFVEMVNLLVNDREIPNNIYIVSQVDLTPQPNFERIKMERSIKKLHKLSLLYKQVEIIEGTLTTKQYYQLLNQVDVIVLPYRNETFNVVPSNIFRETIVAGKVPVIPRNTSMEEELPAGFDEFIFNYADYVDLFRTVKRTVLDYNKYYTQVRAIQRPWAEFHRADKLADYIISC